MLLDVKNVSVRFASGHGVQAVENVSLTVNKKEKVCIVGETGSGKSILLLAILHLLPENAIVTGEAFFEGEDMIRMKRRQLDKIRGARISYVPQGSGNGLNPLLTVGFQVAEPMIEHQKIGKKEAIALGTPALLVTPFPVLAIKLSQQVSPGCSASFPPTVISPLLQYSPTAFPL